MRAVETVAAIATPPGQSGIGVIRISGSLSSKIYKSLTQKKPVANKAIYTSFSKQNHTLIDHGIALYFKAPNSFTGEDVVECQTHGSDIILNLLLNEIFSLGAIPAKPGEFTERAFLNDKIDLLQAEAVADLIESRTEKAAQAAVNSLSGIFSNKLEGISDKIIELKASLEAYLDFPEDDLDIDLSTSTVKLRIIIKQISELLEQAGQANLLNKSLKTVIVGKPNVGKSSLLNYLSGKDLAIVSSSPGTTRDLISHNILLKGIELTLVDTAGIRETDDEIEQKGVLRAYKALEDADIILYVIDKDLENDELRNIVSDKNKQIIIRNKIDLCTNRKFVNEENFVAVSIKTGDGVQDLIERLNSFVKDKNNEESVFFARQRHIVALNEAYNYLKESLLLMERQEPIELIAELQRKALQSFDVLSGKTTNEDILEKIFSSFCIGK